MTDEDVRRTRRWLAIALLAAAVLIWAMAMMMSPHGESTNGGSVDHVKASVAIFARNAALGVLVLVMFAAALLFWRRRPDRSRFDLIAIAVMILLAGTSFYQLIWIETDVLAVEEVQAAPIASEGT